MPRLSVQHSPVKLIKFHIFSNCPVNQGCFFAAGRLKQRIIEGLSCLSLRWSCASSLVIAQLQRLRHAFAKTFYMLKGQTRRAIGVMRLKGIDDRFMFRATATDRLTFQALHDEPANWSIIS